MTGNVIASSPDNTMKSSGTRCTNPRSAGYSPQASLIPMMLSISRQPDHGRGLDVHARAALHAVQMIGI